MNEPDQDQEPQCACDMCEARRIDDAVAAMVEHTAKIEAGSCVYETAMDTCRPSKNAEQQH